MDMIETRHFFPYREVVLSLEVNMCYRERDLKVCPLERVFYCVLYLNYWKF